MDVKDDAGVDAALWGLDAAFVAHRPREVLEGCSHCQREVRVADADPFALALGLGVTIGGPQDVRALTPWLMRRVLSDERLDLHTVLSRIAEHWSTWSDLERDAVRGVVDAVWAAVLDSHPDDATAVAYVDGASGLGDPPDRLVEIWEYKDTPTADHHLAEFVIDTFYGARVPRRVYAWSREPGQIARLRHALVRDEHEPWSGTLAAASELLP